MFKSVLLIALLGFVGKLLAIKNKIPSQFCESAQDLFVYIQGLLPLYLTTCNIAKILNI